MGEVYFLRGWAYFELVRLFGNIPIIDSPMSPSAVKDVAQSPASEVYENIIIPDLTAAKSKLPLMANIRITSYNVCYTKLLRKEDNHYI